MALQTILRITLFLSLISTGYTQSVIEKADTSVISKIRAEISQNSQVMNLLKNLTDINGPRLTFSPGYTKAAGWVKDQLTGWGVENVKFENFEQVGKGWTIRKFSLTAVGNASFPLIAYPKAWSNGVKGTVTGELIYFDIKSEADLLQYKGKLKNKFVLLNSEREIDPHFQPEATRVADSTLLKMTNATPGEQANRRSTEPSSAALLNYKKWKFLIVEGAIATLEGSRGDGGTVFVMGATYPQSPEIEWDKRMASWHPEAEIKMPQIMVAGEHYNRLLRLIEEKEKIKLELNLEVETTTPVNGFNVIAEIPGTNLKDEIVMIGGHLDSWHGGTGSTDNGAGVATCLEAVRIIQKLGLKPKRTIKIGLWGGEEQGLLGSRGFVKQHLGERLDKTAPWDSISYQPDGEKFQVYFNMDNGSGKFRGINMEGNEGTRPIFRAWFSPFEKDGASTLTPRSTGSTDHVAFNAIGLPGFQFIQDPIHYFQRTWHSNMDVYDHALEADLKQTSMIMASFVWMAANREGSFPRKK
ncbi:MAG: M20/M25/M40 family metallo-hydrolase [Bacteroidetes bacterium]|nr:M20/M25/M40 family metallo-hydrolase [Bacteroidota bacterium]